MRKFTYQWLLHRRLVHQTKLEYIVSRTVYMETKLHQYAAFDYLHIYQNILSSVTEKLRVFWSVMRTLQHGCYQTYYEAYYHHRQNRSSKVVPSSKYQRLKILWRGDWFEEFIPYLKYIFCSWTDRSQIGTTGSFTAVGCWFPFFIYLALGGYIHFIGILLILSEKLLLHHLLS